MKLIVGLGNPGQEYKNTRHNVGFMVLDNYLNNVDWKEKFHGLFYKKNDVIFLKPTTFMNLSGISVRECVAYFDISIDDILIIHDDLDLPLGSYKIKKNSSSGGHNGIKSIIEELNSMEFCRLKIGISHNRDIPTDKYVLGKFSANEQSLIACKFDVYNKIIEDFIKNDANYIICHQKED